jgi:hypothetical protein
VFTIEDRASVPIFTLFSTACALRADGRTMVGFPNVVFHDTAHANEQYAPEVWRVPEGDRLKPMDIGFLFRQAQPTRQLG